MINSRFPNIINFLLFLIISLSFYFFIGNFSESQSLAITLYLKYGKSFIFVSKIILILFYPLFLLSIPNIFAWVVFKLTKKELVFKLTYTFIVTLFFGLLVIDFGLSQAMKSHLSLDLLYMGFEPGIFPMLGVTKMIIFIFYLFFMGMMIIQFKLFGLGDFSIPRKFTGSRWAQILNQKILIFTCAIGLFGFSFLQTKDRKFLNLTLGHVPLYDLILDLTEQEALWSTLGLNPNPLLNKKGLFKDHYSLTMEYQTYSDYLKKKPSITDFKTARRWNILFIMPESFRSDVVTKNIMPFTSQFAKEKAFQSKYHFSAGNSSAEALYGLLYGLSPFYWHQSKKERIAPELFRILKILGYTNSVYTFSNLRYRSIKNYIFSNYIDHFNVLELDKNMEGSSEWKRKPLEYRDIAITERYLKDIESRPPGRYMDFLMFYSTHYNYYYPPEFEKFTPALENNFKFHYIRKGKKAKKLFNRYKNAVYFVDSLIEKVVKKIDEIGQLENTVIIITGDHGEEFYEQGRLGHSMSLKRIQTQVPLIFYIPEKFSTKYNITSHSDIVPTLLESMGLNYDVEELFSGKSLLRYDASKDGALIVSMKRRRYPKYYALVKDNYKLMFTNRPQDVIVTKITDLKDKELNSTLNEDLIEDGIDYIMEQKQFFKNKY